MSGIFVTASGHGLRNASHTLPTTGYPCTMGAWFNFNSLGANEGICGLSSTTVANTHLRLLTNATSNVVISGADGTITATATTGTVAVNTWVFVIGRFISATNRRVAVLPLSGVPFHAQGTTSRTPTGLDSLSIGCTFNGTTTPSIVASGMVAEFWITNADIQADGAQLNTELLRQLAYGGPFSVPHIIKDIQEYRSLRVDPAANDLVETYAVGAPPTWTNISGVIVGAHPPLPYWYAKLADRPAPFVI